MHGIEHKNSCSDRGHLASYIADAGPSRRAPVLDALKVPGYPPLSTSISGAAAESTRAAESLHRGGAPEQAVRLLEEALAASLALSPVVPGWLCGRLASLYRTLGRLDDEVRLLERYRESQEDDDARTRYEARLSKARTIAERRRRTESGALSSIRHAVRAPRRSRAAADVPVVPALADSAVRMIGELFQLASDAEFSARLGEVLARYVADARERLVPMEVLVDGLRAAPNAQAVVAPGLATRYSIALVRLLALYFSEDSPSAI